MKLSYKNEIFECEIDGSIFRKNGQEISFSATTYSDNIFKIKIGDLEKKVFTASDGKNFYVFIDGDQYSFSLVTEGFIDLSDSTKGKNCNEEIKPPMPGNVVKILVEEEQEVSEGTPIIIVEAMKMEITLYSSINGKIKKINAAVGEQVDTDKVLVEIQST